MTSESDLDAIMRMAAYETPEEVMLWTRFARFLKAERRRVAKRSEAPRSEAK